MTDDLPLRPPSLYRAAYDLVRAIPGRPAGELTIALALAWPAVPRLQWHAPLAMLVPRGHAMREGGRYWALGTGPRRLADSTQEP